MAIKNDAWTVAQTLVDDLPPFLQDDELTFDRFLERNKDTLSKAEARNVLERLAQSDGPLEKQLRRVRGSKGNRTVVFVLKGKSDDKK
jgi:hypothetical protein